MKSRITFSFLFLLLIAQSSFSQHKKISVLFIGNSYTYVNNLPLLVDSLAAAAGDTLEWDMSAPGGYTFQMHSVDVTTLSKINQQPWDYVVLQEQSQLPSLDPDSVDSTTIPYALLLDSLILANDSCTQIVFYETWGRKYGDAANCAAYPPVCTYSGMQQRLLESYKLMADTCHAIVAPVGEAFRTCIAFDSTTELYQADLSHPSLNGSFLAASVFYNIFFHKSANGNTYDPGVTQQPAYMFHLFAHQTVEDSLNFFNLGINEPWAEFRWHQIGGAGPVYFSQFSNSTFTHIWNFGDSTTSSDPNPVHQYTYSHYFPVYHIVYNQCDTDSFFLANNIVFPYSGTEEFSTSRFRIYPNPTKEILMISGLSNSRASIEINNVIGEKILSLQTNSINELPLNVSKLPEGIYFLRINDEREHFSSLKFTIIR